MWASVWTAVLMAAVAGGTASAREARRPEVTVQSGRLVLRHVMSGRVAARRALDFATPDLGIYPLQIRWLAENGDRVAPGDRLVEFDNSALVSQLEQLELQVDQAGAGLRTAVSLALGKVAEAEFALLQQKVADERARLEADVPQGLKSELEFAKLQLAAEKARLEVTAAETRVEQARLEAEAEVDIARLALEKAEIALATAQSKIERMMITAPAAGLVQLQQNWQQDRLFRAGDSTFPGMTVLWLPDPASLYVEAELYDVDDGEVVEGSAAAIALDAYPAVALTGVVGAIDEVAQQRNRLSLRRVFLVRVELDPDHASFERLLPGMSARVVVERDVGCGPDRSELCVLVDRSALDLLDPGRPVARLASGEERAISIGACNSRTCIVEAGLEPGERLSIVNGAQAR